MRATAAAQLIDLHPAIADMRELVYTGLNQHPKQLPAWFLYDAEGSKLFEQICQQPEYSLTRTEVGLLRAKASSIAKSINQIIAASTANKAAIERPVIIEFGAGNARKAGPLLAAIQPAAYVTLDISLEALQATNQQLQQSFPTTPLLGVCCDHSQLDSLPPHPLLHKQPRIGFFPGSSLGNFSSDEAKALLQRFRKLLKGGPLLIGLDHPKPKPQIEAAYNDAAGFSAAFAKNLLHRLNQELKGRFSAHQFRYQARWEEEQSRVAMELISTCDQDVEVAGHHWTFAAGEALVTEYSMKYDPTAAQALFAAAGWWGVQRWHDPAEHLSLHLLKPLADSK